MCLFITSLTYPQELDLTGDGYGSRLRLQHILPDEGRLGIAEITNVRKYRLSDRDNSINVDGNFLVLENQLIKKDEATFRKIELPFANDQVFVNPILISKGNKIAIPTINEDMSNLEYLIYDINNEFIESRLTIPSTRGLLFNADGTALIYITITDTQIFYNVIVIENDTTETTIALELSAADNLLGPRLRYFSNLGDRIIFTATLRDSREFKYFFIDKLETGWSVPRELQVIDKQNNELHFGLVDIANNGRTLLITNSEIGYSLTHEVNGIWSLPRSTGYIPIPYDSAQISENGKVIKIQTAKRITEIDRFYDVIVLLQNSAGQWVQHQVNDPQLEVHHDGTLLSGDGTKLYWLPANTSHIPNALEYK